MVLTEDNYFSKEASQIYTGSSEIKDFLKCESCALAKLNGEWVKEKTESLLVSSYLDEKISGSLDKFKDSNPEIFTKQGDLKSQYKHIEEIYDEINSERNAMFKKYLSGEPQVIMTGEISGVPIKIKIDSYHKDKAIVDLKCIKDFNLIWNENAKQKEDFITYYDYILQRMFVSRGCKTKHRKTITIYNCSLYKGKISTICFASNSTTRVRFKT